MTLQTEKRDEALLEDVASLISATHAALVPSRAGSLVGCGPARLANSGAAEHFVQRWAALGRVSI